MEVKHISSRSGINVEETLSRLKLAGLDSLPGGGAEILVDSVRDRICRGKESSDEYLSIHEIACLAELGAGQVTGDNFAPPASNPPCLPQRRCRRSGYLERVGYRPKPGTILVRLIHG